MVSEMLIFEHKCLKCDFIPLFSCDSIDDGTLIVATQSDGTYFIFRGVCIIG